MKTIRQIPMFCTLILLISCSQSNSKNPVGQDDPIEPAMTNVKSNEANLMGLELEHRRWA